MTVPADPTGLREQIAEALREAPVRGTVMRMTVLTELYGPVDALADAVLDRVVQPALDLKQAEISRLIAFLERGFETHMQFGVIEADGTTSMLPCADWCYACKLDRAEAERDQLRAQLGRLADVGAAARAAAGLLRDAAERTEQHRPVNAAALRSAAGAIDDIVKET